MQFPLIHHINCIQVINSFVPMFTVHFCFDFNPNANHAGNDHIMCSSLTEDADVQWWALWTCLLSNWYVSVIVFIILSQGRVLCCIVEWCDISGWIIGWFWSMWFSGRFYAERQSARFVLRVDCFNEICWNHAHHHPHRTSEVAGESTLTIHLRSDESMR